jgi:hypothetical protein
MKTVITLDRQRLIDLAMQETGDVSRVFEICELNDMGLTDEIEAGVSILVPDFAADKRRAVALFSDKSIAPASADEETNGTARPGGIGYMQIGNDFIVS